MMTLNQIFDNAIEHWRLSRGVGTCIIQHPLDDRYMLLGILQRLYIKDKTFKTTIIVPNFNERTNIIEFLTNQENEEENNNEFKELIKDKFIKVLTNDFLVKNYPRFPSDLCVFYHVDTVDKLSLSFIEWCKFKLVILNKLLSNEDMNNIYKFAPILDDFKQAEIEQLRLSTPVEETRVAVHIPHESITEKNLNELNEYITTSITIFGTFDMIQKAYRGDKNLNISAKQICLSIAKENGWHEHLDMYLEFDRKIDNLYNPIALQERAENTFSKIRERNNLLSDFDGKLNAIIPIIRDNQDKKFLIINKRAEFATKVTNAINDFYLDNVICMNYHDKVDNIPAFDDNLNPLYYKSGEKKGERKMIGAKAQKSLAECLFNEGKINILSANNMPDKSLSGTIDGIILTSPMCGSITDYLYRMSNLTFNDNKVLLYVIYCKNTLEERTLENKDRAINHNVKNSFQDEDFSDFIVAD